MNLKRRPRESASHLEFPDALIDNYVSWRDESRAVAASYRAWSNAGRGERDVAFARYAAALQREEDAASEWRRAVECAQRSVDAKPGSVRQSADPSLLYLPSATYDVTQ
jgi:hypothetical protein